MKIGKIRIEKKKTWNKRKPKKKTKQKNYKKGMETNEEGKGNTIK
jgi:hypothetical protein